MSPLRKVGRLLISNTINYSLAYRLMCTITNLIIFIAICKLMYYIIKFRNWFAEIANGNNYNCNNYYIPQTKRFSAT